MTTHPSHELPSAVILDRNGIQIADSNGITTITLQPMNLHDPDQFATLLAQRHICGWNNEASILESYRATMDAGERTIFWITVPASIHNTASPDAQTTTTNAHAATPAAQAAIQAINGTPTSHAEINGRSPDFEILLPTIAGHISLDRPQPSDAARGYGTTVLDGTAMKIAFLFIVPSFRQRRIADTAVALLERLACESPYGTPACTSTVVDALSKRYIREEGPWNSGIWARMGLERRPNSTQEWFVGLG